MDLTQKKAQDLHGRRKTIENELNRLTQQIHEMDQKIRFYLTDRQKNAHPRHIEFIDKIQRFRIDPSVSNRHLESLLENVQWKIYYYQRAWNQMWENAEAAFRQNRQPILETPPPPSADRPTSPRPQEERRAGRDPSGTAYRSGPAICFQLRESMSETLALWQPYKNDIGLRISMLPATIEVTITELPLVTATPTATVAPGATLVP